MFKKLFGGDKKKDQPQQQTKAAPPPQQPNTQQQEIEFEKSMNNLNIQIAKMEQSSEVIETKLEKIDQDIRALLGAKKKKQAKTKLMQAQGYKMQIDKLETQKNVLIGMKIKLETAQTNQSSVGVIGDVNKLLKDQEKVNEKMQEQMEDYTDIVQSQQEQDMMWKQLQEMQNQDMEDVDDELQRYEKEVEQEQAQKVANDFNNIPIVNVQPQLQQNMYQQKQQVQQPMKTQQQSAFEDQMNMLLN